MKENKKTQKKSLLELKKTKITNFKKSVIQGGGPGQSESDIAKKK